MLKNLTIPLCLGLIACGPSGNKKAKDSLGELATAVHKTDVVQDDKETVIVSTSEKSIVTEISRPPIVYFGKAIKTHFARLTKDVRAEASTIMQQINNHQGVMSGPLTYIYLKTPSGDAVELFVGVPVKKEFDDPEIGSFMRLSGGKYYKMQCDCEPGETLKSHLELQKLLKEANKSYGAPALEVFNESRNGNMAPISKATILYPVKN